MPDNRPNLPSAADLLGAMKTRLQDSTQRSDIPCADGSDKQWAIDTQRRYVHLQGIQDHYNHKRKWSWFIMGVLAAMILFQFTLIVCVGIGEWDFTKYEWLLPTLLVQNLAQIIGLAFIVVKSLFKEHATT